MKEKILLLIVLIIGVILHGVNMFHYPYFENDEGTYFAQAWSFLSEGRLAPYTYWYDHAPFGWIFTSLWIALTGGPFTFGFSLHSGRVLMLVMHLASSFFLFKITKQLTKSHLSALITSFFFSVSPLAIYFHRRLLLDNLMIFWVLATFFLIVFARQRLLYFILSAITFGIGVLTKENAIFFFPFFLWLVFREAHQMNRLFAIIKWVVITGMIISLYPLYALLKQELFPAGTFFSPPWDHVSLIGTLQNHSQRGTGLPFWNVQSDFMTNVAYWYSKDALLVVLGAISFLFQAVAAFFSQTSRVIFFATLSIMLFFISGKLVINFYVIALIPFIALCIGYTMRQVVNITRALPNKYLARGVEAFLIVFLLVGLTYHYYQPLKQPLMVDETSKQIEAINWIKKNLPPESTIAIDFYGYADLSQSRFPGDPRFPNADWFWKVEMDPDIRVGKLHNDPNKLDYVMLTAEVHRHTRTFPEDSLIRTALNNNSALATFNPYYDFTIDPKLYNPKYPNGDWLGIYKNNKTNAKTLIANDSGRVIDPWTHKTTSEGQSYALLQAVWSGDRERFNSVLHWTRDHLLLEDKNLFAWQYGENDAGKLTVLDKSSATDADQDIALALLFAYKQWGDNTYFELAKKIIDDIWNYETVEVAQKRYLVAGDWASAPNNTAYTINPSYLSPYLYRIFAQMDTQHDWMALVDSSYEILDRCSQAPLDASRPVYLPPNWCNLTKQGKIIPAENLGEAASDYSFDAMRVLWRIGLDYQWNKELRAKKYLEKITLFRKEWQKNNKIATVYTHSGEAKDTNENLAQYSAQLAYFSIVDKKVAKAIYEEKIAPQYHNENGQSYWGDKNNYYDQHWVWFGTAFYLNKLPNLWQQ